VMLVPIPYDNFRYIYPPRPENRVHRGAVSGYEGRGFVAQPKLNGDCMLVFTNGKEVHTYNRHKQTFAKKILHADTFGQLHRQSIVDQERKWMCLVGEYMIKSKKDASGRPWNDKFVIFDILVYDGVQLIGSTVSERIALLDLLYGTQDLSLTGDGVAHHGVLFSTSVKDVFRVKSYPSFFGKLYDDITKIDMFEGLVLKQSNAKLENGAREFNNSSWQIKIRKETKNYTY
jgi:hypothetical protein